MGIFGSNHSQVRIHTTINREDQEYCRKHALRYAHLLRASIRDHRVNSGDPKADESAREIVNQRDTLKKHRDKILQAIRKKLGEEGFVKFIQNI